MAEEKEDPMELWNQVCKTDPETTRRVTQRGGFTAICAQSQLKRATELWGPFGGEWGTRDDYWSYLGTDDQMPWEITYEATFYYPGGAFCISSDQKYKAGDDCRKKVQTDALTKGLSRLGFNSDVFEGRFDDNKYVEQMQQRFHGINESQLKFVREALDPSRHAEFAHWASGQRVRALEQLSAAEGDRLAKHVIDQRNKAAAAATAE